MTLRITDEARERATDEILEVCQLAAKHFPESEVSLEVYHDPEIEDSHLVLYIRQDSYKLDSVKKIKAFRKRYGIKEPHVTTDFKKPVKAKGG